MSEFEKFKYHSNIAIRRTVSAVFIDILWLKYNLYFRFIQAISFIFLMFIMLLSYVVSEYEYNNVKEQYQKAFNDANATFVQSVFTKRLNQTLNDQVIAQNGTNSTMLGGNETNATATTKTMKKHKKKADQKAVEEDEDYKLFLEMKAKKQSGSSPHDQGYDF
jgi:hypothetical protein